MSEAQIGAMIEDATVDCYNEDEQITGWFTMLDEHLVVPFQTMVLGAAVTVERLDLTSSNQIVAVCSRDRVRQRISLLELPLPTPPLEGGEWIEAYLHWHRAAYGK